MALKKCNECDCEISTKAKSCPKCGAVIKKKRGCLGYIGVGILLFFILAVISSLTNDGSKKTSTASSPVTSSSATNASAQKMYKESDSVSIGYTSYLVSRSWWSTKLSDNEYLNEKADAMFLFVEITIRNDDKKARSIAPFELIDENGSEYETSDKGFALDGSIGILDSLNPGVQKQGFIIFDVPQNHKYKLKVSGGYWSTDEALIELSPK